MGKSRKAKRGKSARNAKNALGTAEPEEIVKAPHSFVVHRGKLGKNAKELMYNFRKIMEPYTASQLRVQRKNVIKDFVHMAGPLNVSHLVVFTKSEKAMYLKIAKLPRGPTLTYQINEYCLLKDVISSQKKSLIYEQLFEHHPLLVLNNFSGEGMHFKLMATMFQNMFPSINVNKTNLNTIRRCLLLHYNDDKTVEMRQYAIKIVPTGISKAVKKLIRNKVPNLANFQTVDEFMEKAGNLSESEAEMDSAANTIVLPQPISTRGNMVSEKSAVRMYEIGPRMNLKLIKIEEGVMTGEVMYHEYIKRTPEEIKALKERLKAKRILKEKRRAEQKRNVEKKMAKKKGESPVTDAAAQEGKESDDDLEYYRQEVGEEPDENILPGILKKKKYQEKLNLSNKRKASDTDSKFVKKKRKLNESNKDSSEKSGKEGVTLQKFLTRRRKRKEAKLVAKKNKQMSQKVLSLRAKQNRSKK